MHNSYCTNINLSYLAVVGQPTDVDHGHDETGCVARLKRVPVHAFHGDVVVFSQVHFDRCWTDWLVIESSKELLS